MPTYAQERFAEALEFVGVTAEDVWDKGRESWRVNARWKIMRHMRESDRRGIGLTTTEIGEQLGCDHTTVLHGLKKVPGNSLNPDIVLAEVLAEIGIDFWPFDRSWGCLRRSRHLVVLRDWVYERMRARGLSYPEIAAACGVPHSIVVSACRVRSVSGK